MTFGHNPGCIAAVAPTCLNTTSDLNIDYDACLGEGAFGAVFVAHLNMLKGVTEDVCVKLFVKSYIGTTDKAIIKEAALLSTLNDTGPLFTKR